MEEKEIIEKLLSLEETYKLLIERETERNKEIKEIHSRLDSLNDKLDGLINSVSELEKLESLKTDMTNFKTDMRTTMENLDKSIQQSFDSFLIAYKEAITKDAGNNGELVLKKVKVKSKKLAKSSVNPTAKDSTKRKKAK